MKKTYIFPEVKVVNMKVQNILQDARLGYRRCWQSEISWVPLVLAEQASLTMNGMRSKM